MSNNWIFLLVGCISTLFISCENGDGKVSVQNERIDEDSQIEQGSSIPCDTIRRSGQVLIKKGAWTYCDLADPMSDKITYMANNESENTSQVTIGKTHLYLTLTYVDAQSLIGLMIQEGAFETGHLPQVYVRFDNEEVQTFSVMADTRQAVYIMDYDRFINGLQKAKRIAIQVEDLNRQKITFTFSNVGFSWNHPRNL